MFLGRTPPDAGLVLIQVKESDQPFFLALQFSHLSACLHGTHTPLHYRRVQAETSSIRRKVALTGDKEITTSHFLSEIVFFYSRQLYNNPKTIPVVVNYRFTIQHLFMRLRCVTQGFKVALNVLVIRSTRREWYTAKENELCLKINPSVMKCIHINCFCLLHIPCSFWAVHAQYSY